MSAPEAAMEPAVGVGPNTVAASDPLTGGPELLGRDANLPQPEGIEPNEGQDSFGPIHRGHSGPVALDPGRIVVRPVPEASTWLQLLAGLAVLSGLRLRRRRPQAPEWRHARRSAGQARDRRDPRCCRGWVVALQGLEPRTCGL
jgi:hypothetical protein